MEEFNDIEIEEKDKPRLEMSSKRRWLVTIGVMTGMFIAALEATVVGTAMPTVIAVLGGLNHYSWVFSAYLITSTVTVPVWGKLSDLYGRRLLYQLGIGVFLLGSVLSGMSASMTQLIIFRAVQGLGAGALVPLAMTIIGDIFTLKERAKMQAYFSGVWGLSSVVGPIVGGFITDQLSWRWVFYINVPVGLAAAMIIGIALKEPKHTERPAIDYAGAGLLMASITLMMLALVEGGTTIQTLFAPENLIFIGGSIILILLFALVERRAADPIIPFHLFQNRTVSVAVSAGFLAGVAMFGAISFVPLFAQGALGSTATEAGSLLTPLMLSWVSMSVVGGRLLLRLGYRTISIVGFILLTVGFICIAMFDRGTARVWLYADLVLIGSGLGLTMLTLLIAAQQAVKKTELGVATALTQFSRSIGGAFGVAIMGAVLSAGLIVNLNAAVEKGSGISQTQAEAFAANPNALIDPKAQSALSSDTLGILRDAMAASIHKVFWVGAVLSFLSLLVTLLLPHSISREDESPSREDLPRGESGERFIMAELTTLESEDEPSALSRPKSAGEI